MTTRDPMTAAAVRELAALPVTDHPDTCAAVAIRGAGAALARALEHGAERANERGRWLDRHRDDTAAAYQRGRAAALLELAALLRADSTERGLLLARIGTPAAHRGGPAHRRATGAA